MEPIDIMLSPFHHHRCKYLYTFLSLLYIPAQFLPSLVACHPRGRRALTGDAHDVPKRISMKPRHCREICSEGIALAGFELLNQRIDRLLDQLLNGITPLSTAVRALGV